MSCNEPVKNVKNGEVTTSLNLNDRVGSHAASSRQRTQEEISQQTLVLS